MEDDFSYLTFQVRKTVFVCASQIKTEENFGFLRVLFILGIFMIYQLIQKSFMSEIRAVLNYF